MDDAMREIRRLRRSAWLWRGAGLLAVAWAMFRPVGAVEPQGRPLKTIEAERLVIKDKSGKVRVVLGTWEEVIVVNDGINRARDGSAGMKVYSAKDPSQSRVTVVANEDDTQRIMLETSKGRNAFVGNLVDGSELSISDDKKVDRLHFGLNGDGNPNLSILDSKAQSRFQVGIGPDAGQTPYMDTFDAKGNDFPLLDKAGRPISRAGTPTAP